MSASFYWDECWPYASGIYNMYHSGPSLLPGSIDGELSRGHPLMFHFLGALWMKLFGSSVVSLHTYALSISMLFLAFIYEVSLRFFGFRAAVLALFMVAFQQIYFVQSAFVLLEIMVAFLCFASLYFYVVEHYFLAGLALTLLFLTKESGLVMGAVIGIDALIKFCSNVKDWKKHSGRILCVGIPSLIMIAFFLIQKKVSGWYVLPMYSSMEENLEHYYDKLMVCFKLVFIEGHRYLIYSLLVLLALTATILKKNFRFLLPALCGLLIHILCVRLFPSDKILVYVLVLCFASLTWCVLTMNKVVAGGNTAAQRFMLMGLVFSFLFFFFSSSLFIIARYLLPAIVMILFIAAVYLNYYISRLSPNFFFPLLLVILGFEAYSFYSSDGMSDFEIGAFDGIKVHEEVVQFLEANDYYDTKIGAGGYMEVVHLTDTNTQYLSSRRVFTDVKWDIGPETKLAIFDNIERDHRYDDFKKDTSFGLIHRISSGNAWAEIYEKKNVATPE